MASKVCSCRLRTRIAEHALMALMRQWSKDRKEAKSIIRWLLLHSGIAWDDSEVTKKAWIDKAMMYVGMRK